MPRIISSLVALAAAVEFTRSAAVGYGNAIQCTSFFIPITASATIVQLPTDLNITEAASLDLAALNSFGKEVIGGTYNIAARLCEPTKYVASRHNTLQLLVHGVQQTKDYWSGLAPPGQGIDGVKYDWVSWAAAEGYPTLAFDRICNGQSDHPSGFTACQTSLNSEVLLGVIQKASSGAVGGRKFTKIIPICQGEGSGICEFLMQTHPTVLNDYILTSFTSFVGVGGPGNTIHAAYLPAALALPDRYGNLDLGYLVATNKAGDNAVYYDGDYSQKVFNYDYNHRGTISISEFATSPLVQVPAPLYTGSVFLLLGQEDQVMCTRKPSDSLVGHNGQCGTGPTSLPALSRVLFPAARSFQYATVPRTGHFLNLHNSAYQAYKIASSYLVAPGF